MVKYPYTFAAALGLSLLFYIPGDFEPYDGGGSVMKYYRDVQAANRRSQLVAINGTCASSCTMKLGIKRLCIDPTATLLFHQASHVGTTLKSEDGTKRFMSMYPKNIQKWVRNNGQALNSHDLTKMTGKEAISLGIRSCWSSRT